MTGPTEQSHVSLDPATLDTALTRAGCTPRAGEGWSACRSPEHVLRIGSDGRARPCEFGNSELLDESPADWLAAWRSPAFEALRNSLRDGQLPNDYCRGCARWTDAALTAHAPLATHYGHLDQNADDHPSRIVLELPAAGLQPSDRTQLTKALRGAKQLVVVCSKPLSEQLDAGWLEPLLALPTRPTTTLSVHAFGEVAACSAALHNVQIDAIEVAVDGTDTSELAKATTLAEPHRARVCARYLVTPDNWLWLEHTARSIAELDVTMQVQVLADDGNAPMDTVSIEALTFAKDVFASAWQRFTEDQRPPSSGPNTHADLVSELRGLVESRVAQQLASSDDEDTAQSLALPAMDHPWLADKNYAAWFHVRLFGHSHLAIVHDWALEIAMGEQGAQALRQHSWLRVLSQKLAFERRSTELLSALRDLYDAKNGDEDFAAADRAFAEEVDLRVFGGPWQDKLRLLQQPRTAPFEVPTTPAADAGNAQITILIPSYKHGLYIADTIRSALAQQGAPVKVLVVDDQSPDDTVAVARSIADPRLEVRVNERNLGLGNSVLQALDTIDTPYVALLNSDDVLHPQRIALCLEALNADPETQVVTTDLALIDHEGGELTPDNVSLVHDGVQVHNWVNWYKDARPANDLPKQDVFEELLERNFLATSSNLTARTDWLRKKHTAFQNLKYCLDWQIFLEAALDGTLQHIGKPLAGYRLHATNTVWFEEGGRWAFFLEVNRVLAEALKHHVQRHGTVDEDLVHRVTNAVAGHIAANREADGHALFLNTIMDGLTVDRIAAESERVQELLRSLRKTAANAVAARDAAENAGADSPESTALKKQLTQIRQERLSNENDSLLAREHSLQHTVNRLHREVSAASERQAKAAARADQTSSEKRSLRQEFEANRKQLERRIADTTGRETSLRGKVDALREELAKVREAEAAKQRDLHNRLADRRQDIDRLKEQAASLKSEFAKASAELAVTTRERDRLHADLDAVRKELDALRKELDAVRKEKDAQVAQLTERRNQLITEGNHLRAELEKLRNSREFRAGNFLWNKLPLSYMSRRGKKLFNRLVDVKNRVALWAGGKVKKPTAEGVAVVASCWHWPIYSHTFVYQEMIGLTHMGLDLKMFHWADNDMDQLQPAFAYLKDNRVQLKANMKQHRKDKEHFDKTKPGRLDALLERLAGPTGKTVEELAEEPMVLRACTFARMAELANARYLHSYFFYDQSFMTFVTAWLLDIPRGVSCYADHMMDDFPFKVVALQLQMASVVVATSARIKTELVGIGGEECADKIVVKPNGVNGERFPAIDRGERNADEPFEVISISRLEPKKGLEYMIEAVADLKKRGRKIIVHIIGAVDTSIQASIDYGVELEHQIKKLGLEEEVILHGMKMHEAIAPILKRSRAFVAPYVELESGDKDGIPTAILEALASGLPIVTTDAGSILEIVQDGVQALVSPQRDSKAYGEALDKLIANPELERKLAQEARKRFDEEFDIKVTERRLHERVAGVLQQTPVAR